MRVAKVIKKYGVIGCIVKFLNKLSYRIFRFFNRLDEKITKKRKEKIKAENQIQYEFLKNLILKKKYKYVFVFYPYSEWNLPVFQRPQQIALELSKRNDTLYLFCSANCHLDSIDGVYEKINENLYIVTDYDYIKSIETDKRIIHLYSTDVVSKYSEVQEALDRNDKVLYEYIDEIHEEITQSIPKEYLEKHNKILQNEECYVVTTADKLYDDAKKYRKKRLVLSTNGVNVEDFLRNDNDEIPDDLKHIKNNYDKLLCYYGSLAKWFDYELIKKIAKKYPSYAIVLIGMEYDDSFKNSNIEKLKNVFYLGKKNYYDLHKYSEKTDLLMIPFLINDITESTSPVKLFEYMATEVPILTTNMKECRKYKSVIIGKNHEDFINKIDSTIELINDKEYIELEKKEAIENTWTSKAKIIIELLKK